MAVEQAKVKRLRETLEMFAKHGAGNSVAARVLKETE